MKSLNDTYIDFLHKFKAIRLFINENFGFKDILIRKNQGLIKEREFGIKNSKVTGYVFHGFGCEFRLNNEIIDIEFGTNNSIGFTKWSFFSYCKQFNTHITELEVEKYLQRQVEMNSLIYTGKIYEMR